MLSAFWIVVLSFTTVSQTGRCLVTAQSTKWPKVYQPDKELSVNVGDSATLQCCDLAVTHDEVLWYKQQNEKQPQVLVRFFKTDRAKFYKEFQNSRFQIKKFGHCFNLTISNTTLSDEATYYCALVSTDGTRLKIKGERVNAETSKPAVCDRSAACKPTPHVNVNTNTQHNTVIGLGSALGMCAVLIFGLVYFILRRRKRDKMNSYVEDSSEMIQESDTETLTYAAVHFTKRKAKAEKTKPKLSEDCVYSSV